ncbi:hypothetical protein SAMN04488023_1198 [Pedobacter rhizosphaerae]|uniref:Uncharacterized protein n=1 Tax=Pedobacter rhizosphaerae TaxID=390241 RepID=A0A1H9SPQ3_9SPHI|nr:hypothetical protein SAMN04488023_1198 [Pedobacter rhizosphaerae]
MFYISVGNNLKTLFSPFHSNIFSLGLLKYKHIYNYGRETPL